ncbi:MAG: response regulator, partial [Desulfarculus sp.]|nr:response regulator [Desulfarculus sp.]
WLSRRLAGRFETVAEGARRIASGQEVEHWPGSSIREFQALAGDLRHMAQAVRQREESLRLSEAKFRRLAQSSPLGLHLYQLMPGGRLVLSEANPAADAILGLDHRQILGRGIEEAFPGLAAGPAPARFREVASQGGLWQDDQVAYRHGSINRVFEVRAFQGEPGQVAVLFNDITQRKGAEEAIRQSEATLRGIYRASPAGIGMISFPGRRLLWANERMAEMSGYSLENELIGLASRRGYPSQEEYERVGRLIEEGIRSQGVASVETQMVRKDGSLMDVLIKCAPLEPRDPSAGLVFMLLDVTEAKRLARDKAELEARLRQAQKMEAVGTLAGGIAHDFNNILAIIMGNADMARDEVPAQGPQAEMLGRILSACQRGKGLVKQILAFSRQRGRQPLAMDPAVIWKETLKLLKATLPANIKIEQRLAFGGSCLLADPTELHQMLMNLCANAAHAMGQDGGILTVELTEVGLEEDARTLDLAPGRYFSLSVRDTGQGMDQATRERVFEPYFTTKAPGEGSGLGLAVVHGLVQALGGAISVHSQPGRGATFQILLPVAPQAAAAPPTTDSQPASRGSGRVLLVDDEPEVLALGRHMLGRLGYVVIPHANGALAWQAFQADPGTFDAVVTDQAMPEMTGLMLARRIRSLPSQVPIILCTGFMEPSLDQEIQELGIAEVINKPYSKARLATAVQRALSGGQPSPGP